MKTTTLTEAMEAVHTAVSKAEGRAMAYERHVHTLLGFIEAMAAKADVGDMTRAVCTGIAAEVGSACTFTKGTK